MKTKNTKTNEPHRFRLSLADKFNLKNPNRNIELGNLSIFYTRKNIKSAYKNNKFKIPAPTWNGTFDLLDGSCSIADIQDYFGFIIKKLETLTGNPHVQIYPNKIKSRIVFKIKVGYTLELLSQETMKLLGSRRKEVDKDKDREDVRKLEPVEGILVHSNLVYNSYHQASKVLFTFVPNKQFGQLLNISPHSLTMLAKTNTEFLFIEVWFTDQNSEPLEIKDNVNLALIIGLTLKKWDEKDKPKFRKYVKRYGFLSFARKFGDKYSEKLIDTATKTGIDPAKTAFKRVVQKTAEAKADLMGNKIADKITSLGKRKSKDKETEDERQEIYISPKKREQIVDGLRLF